MVFTPRTEANVLS